MIVCKFGGTSVQDAPAIERLIAIARRRLPEQPVVVVSALAGVTDELFALAEGAERGQPRQVHRALERLRERHVTLASGIGGSGVVPGLEGAIEAIRFRLDASAGRALSPEERDWLVGHGEHWSAQLVTSALVAAGLSAQWADARRLIVTDQRFGRATPDTSAIAERARAELPLLLERGTIPLVQGFVGATPDGRPTTLGRGGSDFTAALIGAALGARRVEIWTDVDGIMTADPRIVPEARTLPSATYDEAAELATFGAKVLHPSTQLPLAEAKIPIVVLNSQRPDNPGTVIGATRSSALRAGGPVGSISWKRGIIVVQVRAPRMLGAYGFLRQLFEVFERNEVVVDVLASSEVSVSLTIEDDTRLDALVRDLSPLGEVTITEGRAIVAVVGHGVQSTPGIAGRVFAACQPANVEVISQGASAINLTFVVREDDAPDVVRRLHRTFFDAA